MPQLKLDDGTLKEISPQGFCEGIGEIVGGVEYDNFGRVSNSFSYVQVTEYANQLKWKHKNGKQRVFLLTSKSKVDGSYEVIL